MNRFFDDFDMSMLVPVDAAMVEDALENPDRSASELLLLYFACLTNDPDEIAIDDAAERVGLAISDLADDGDEEAMMAMMAIQGVSSDDSTEAEVVIGIAMLNAVASRPLLRSVISGDLDHETAAGALSVVNLLCSQLVGNLSDSDGLDDLDLDDLDFSELAAELGVSDFDVDGEWDDR